MKPELPSTKPKQRRHIEKLMALADNEMIGMVKEGREPSPSFRLLYQGLHDLYVQMHNRVGPRGRTVSDPMTPEKIREVLRLKAEHPDWAHQEIAHRTNVNIGRVSEILRGKRT